MTLLVLPPDPVTGSSPIAEVVCEPTPDMINRLEAQFGEKRFGRGTRGYAQIMEVWADDSGDWTLIMTYASGTSCIVAMGENWEGVAREDPA